MNRTRSQERLTLLLLGAGIAVPFLYYGLQLVAAPLYPGFSILGTTASELGSDRAPYAAIFNVGIVILGVTTFAAAVGYLRALRRLGTNLVLAALTFTALAVNGVQSLWAASFPMPDSRHGGHPALVVGMILLPFLLAAALWRQGGGRLLKAYLIANMVLLVAMIPIMSGQSGLDMQACKGLFQRIFTLTVFPPIGVGAYVLARRIKTYPDGPGVGVA